MCFSGASNSCFIPFVIVVCFSSLSSAAGFLQGAVRGRSFQPTPRNTFSGDVGGMELGLCDEKDVSMGQNLMGTFWEDYHLLKGFLGSWGVRGFDPLPCVLWFLLVFF